MRDWRKWFKAAAIRAVKSMAEGALAVIGSAALISEVDWRAVILGAGMAGITSILLSLKGLPEEKTVEVYVGQSAGQVLPEREDEV